VILFSQSMDQSEIYIMDPDQRARQNKRSGMEAQDSCKARGNKSGKLPEVVITRKYRPERRIGQ